MTDHDFQARGEPHRQALGIDGTAGDAQDVPHPFIRDEPTGACVVCGLSEFYSKHVLGYIVLIHDDKRPGWLDGWDGEVHTDLSKARESLTAARKDGYEAVLAEQRAMEGE